MVKKWTEEEQSQFKQAEMDGREAAEKGLKRYGQPYSYAENTTTPSFREAMKKAWHKGYDNAKR